MVYSEISNTKESRGGGRKKQKDIRHTENK